MTSVEAQLAEPIQSPAGTRARDVGQADDSQPPIAVPDHHDAPAALLERFHPLGDGRRNRGRAPLEQPEAPDLDDLPLDDRPHAARRDAFHVARVGECQPVGLGAAHDGGRQRVLGPAFDGRRDAEQLRLSHLGHRHEVRDLRLPGRQRPGLVERHGPNAAECFQVFAPFDQHPFAGGLRVCESFG